MIQVENKNYDEVKHNILSSDRPVLIKGASAEWKASKEWSLDYFKTHFGDALVPLSNYTVDPHKVARHKPKVKLAEYIDVIEGRAAHDVINKDSYVAGWHFLRTDPKLMNDIQIPTCFDHSIIDKINKGVINYDYISLFIGHERVESPLHTDSMAVSVWLSNVVGEKVVRFVPPWDYKVIKNGLDIFDDKNIKLLESMDLPVYEAHLKAGDTLVIPPGYWHQVKNLGITIAVSTNYVTPYHFLTFEQQLPSKIFAPYFRLMNIKREYLKQGVAEAHSQESLENFKYIENEEKFLNFMQEQINMDLELIENLKKRNQGHAAV